MEGESVAKHRRAPTTVPACFERLILSKSTEQKSESSSPSIIPAVLICLHFHYHAGIPPAKSQSTNPEFSASDAAPRPPKGETHDALSILRRQTNRSAKDRVPRPQFLSPPEMPLLRVSLQYPREARTMEPRGSEVARAPSIAERMGQSAGASSAWEV